MGNDTPNPLTIPEQAPPVPSPEEIAHHRRITIGLVVGAVIILAILIASLVFLLSPSTDPILVARIRDVFIIFMALESLILGLVIAILAIQLARLTNLLQNEVKPILDSTNETINNLKGTTAFLSNNLVEPIIKLNEYLAAIQRFTEMLGINRKRKV